MSSALSKTRSIALSYVTYECASPPEYNTAAAVLAGRIIGRLWKNWGTDKNGLRLNEVDLYNINIPIAGNKWMQLLLHVSQRHFMEQLLQSEGMEVCWTMVWSNSYAKLFKPQSECGTSVSAAGPNAPPSTTTTPGQSNIPSHSELQQGPEDRPAGPSPLDQCISTSPHSFDNPSKLAKLQPPKLVFNFAYSPDRRNANFPPLTGTDTWAVKKKKASVTPLRAGFCPDGEGEEITRGTIWKW